ncbi:MAG: DUF485 domain-containing protein [Flavobacteriales bacterium]
MSEHKTQEVLQSVEFKKLTKKRWSVALILTAFMLLAYFGFLLMVAFDKDFFKQKIGEVTTIAIPIGIGLILLAWLMTGIYTYWANNFYDKEVEELKKKL